MDHLPGTASEEPSEEPSEEHRRVPPRIQAHRGSPDPDGGVAENTIEAFARAGRLGADGVELDVRLTADGALAVHHDPEIAGVGPISSLTVGRLPSVVPLLAGVLDALGDLQLNIEVKNLPTEPGHDPDELAARAVAAMVAETGALHRAVVSSFSAPALVAARQMVPELSTGLLTPGWLEGRVALDLAAELGVDALHVPVAVVSPDLVDAAHRAGLDVVAWTVRGADDSLAVARAGVDAVITDDVVATVGALRGPRRAEAGAPWPS